MRRKNEMFEFTLTAILGAIILLMSLIPQLGFITVMPGVSITLVHIPVLVGVVLLKPKSSLILGLFFGIGAMLAAFLYGTNPLDLAFQMPWNSIIPRVLFAGAGILVLRGFKKINDLKYGKLISTIIVSIITVVTLFVGKNILINSFNIENYRTVVTIITIILSIILIILYVRFIYKTKKIYAYLPTSFIVSTVVHTILVLSFVALFSPSYFKESFGDSNALNIIYTIAATNGIIEAIVAALIATPVSIAVLEAIGED